jgi:hypothetical protein
VDSSAFLGTAAIEIHYQEVQRVMMGGGKDRGGGAGISGCRRTCCSGRKWWWRQQQQQQQRSACYSLVQLCPHDASQAGFSGQVSSSKT